MLRLKVTTSAKESTQIGNYPFNHIPSKQDNNHTHDVLKLLEVEFQMSIKKINQQKLEAEKRNQQLRQILEQILSICQYKIPAIQKHQKLLDLLAKMEPQL